MQDVDIEEDIDSPVLVAPHYDSTEKRGDYARQLPKEFLEQVRSFGFPYYKFDESYLKIWRKLKNYNAFCIETNNHIQMSGTFSKLASVFFPHMFDVEIPGKVTPKHSWNNDKQLSLAIEMATERGEKLLKLADLRGVLKWVNGSQCVSNFRPEVAKYLYDRYARGGAVYDYSMGWGGRMTGFLASSAKMYVGVDVNKLNFPAYQNIIKTYRPDFDKKVFPIESPAEKYRGAANYFDFAFSSPPYFNKEKYSDDEAQSFKQYTDCDGWVAGFLVPVIQNIHHMLKFDGVWGINIADIKNGTKEFPLLDLTKQKAAENGFVQVDELVYDLPRVPGKGENRKPETVGIYVKEEYFKSCDYDEQRWKFREPTLDGLF